MNKLLYKIDLKVLFVTSLLFSICIGVISSKISLLSSSLIHNFSMDIFVLLCVLYGLHWLFIRVYRINIKCVSTKYLNLTYNRYLEKVIDSKMCDINHTSTGKIFDAVKDIGLHRSTIFCLCLELITNGIPFVILIYKEFQLGILPPIITITAIIISVVLVSLSNKLFGFDTIGKMKKSKITSDTVDNFMNIKTIKYLYLKSYAIDRLERAQRDGFEYIVNYKKIMFYGISILCVECPMLLNIYLSRNNPEMLTLIILFDYCVQNVAYNLSDLADQIIEIHAQKNVISDLKGDDKKEMNIITNEEFKDRHSFKLGPLVLENIDFDYGKDSISFHIDKLVFNKNNRYLIKGKSGEGKSSLANLIAGAIRPTKGELKQANVFYFYQETEMLNASLMENIVFDNPMKATIEEIDDLMRSVGMYEWLQSLKDGYNTLIGERGCRLSSGQKQRINIIRAILIMKACDDDCIFILDEITSNLDKLTEVKVIDLIDKICMTTLIVISHRSGFEKICENIITVDGHTFKQY